MLRILIVEDELGVRKDLNGLLKLRKDVIFLGEATNIIQAKTLIETTQPDVVLLDIHLEDGTAFDLLAKFQQINFHIIFITAYDNFAIKAIKVGAFDYLLKPVDMEELFSALDKIKQSKNNAPHKEQILHTLNHAENPKPDKFILKTNEGIHVIVYKEIIYCKSEGAYTYFHLSDGRIIIASKPIKEYEELLIEDGFVRCHQSYIANISQIIKIDRDDNLVLRNGICIPVATRRKELVLQMIVN